MQSTDLPAGWYGTIDKFLDQTGAAIREDLRGFVSALILPASESQERAWADSVELPIVGTHL